MNNVLDRAADVIFDATFETPWRVTTHEVDLPHNSGKCLMYLEANGVYAIAEALAAAGLLVTDEIQAVLDAVGVLCRTLFGHLPTLVDDIETAYDAYLAARTARDGVSDG